MLLLKALILLPTLFQLGIKGSSKFPLASLTGNRTIDIAILQSLIFWLYPSCRFAGRNFSHKSVYNYLKLMFRMHV